RSPFDDDDSSTIRRKKISIREDSASGGSGMFSSDQADDSGLPLPGEGSRRNDASGDDADDGVKRRKINIKADDGSASSALVQDMMKMDTPPGDAPPAPKPEKESGKEARQETAEPEVRRKKIKIVASPDDAPVMASLSEPVEQDELKAALSSAEEERPVQRKKIAIVPDKPENDEPAISEEMLAGALGEPPVRSGGSGVYTTIESDSELKAAHASESQGATENPEVPGETGAGGDAAPTGEQPVKRTIKIKSTQ
ncbi:MAG: hypothetical protein K9I93_10850, partial [Chlorobium sp.]|nr:hypothetical protein [Chlorobium sp.]